MAENPDTQPVPVPLALFVGNDPTLIVQTAGLLAHRPEFAPPDVEKTPAAWRRALDAYLRTPRT